MLTLAGQFQTSSNNFQQVATTRNNTQHGVQTLATCWVQQCCVLLANNVVSVCTGLYKAWFSYVGKIADDGGFYFLPTIPDFADISDIRQRSVPDFRETIRLFVIGGLTPSNLGDW